MNITWFAFGDVTTTANGRYSPIASLRLRLLVPIEHLEAAGHRVQLLHLEPRDTPESIVPQVSGDVVIFSKVMGLGDDAFDRLAALTLRVMEALQHARRKVIVDVCDDLFAVPVYGDFLKALVRRADLVVTGSARMAEVVGSHSSRPRHVIGEPFEGDRGEARFAPPPPRARGMLGRLIGNVARREAAGGRLKVLWFGHGSNYPPVLEFIPQLERLVDRYDLELCLITAAETGAAALCASFNEKHGARCELRFLPWSADAMQRGLADCDLVVIPTRLDDAAKLVKSSNRLVQSLWSGRFVVAHPIESYRELGAYSWIGTDLVNGIEWALANPREVRRRLAAGQDHVEAHYAPPAIARQWDAAIRAARSPGMVQSPAT